MTYYANNDYFGFQQAEAQRESFAAWIVEHREELKEQWPELWEEKNEDERSAESGEEAVG